MAKYDKIDSELAYFQKRSRGNSFTKTDFRPNNNFYFSGVNFTFFLIYPQPGKNFFPDF